MGTASVEAVKALQVTGVQKPPRRVGKWLWDRFVVAPEKKKVKKPTGLEMRPALLRQDRLGTTRRSAVVSQAARCGVC
jgi:hypothetical protein